MGFILTSLNVVRIAFSCCEAKRRSATRARRRLIGTRCSGRAPAGTGAVAAAGAAAGLAAAFCTSSFKTRPSRPEPCSAFTSTPVSAASFAAAGIAALVCAAAGAASGAGAAAGVSAEAVAAVSMRANTCSAATVSPFWAMISTNTPACGEGTSKTTLSVSMSIRISSRATASPTFFFHSKSMPSDTLSDSMGTFTSIIILCLRMVVGFQTTCCVLSLLFGGRSV